MLIPAVFTFEIEVCNVWLQSSKWFATRRAAEKAQDMYIKICEENGLTIRARIIKGM